MFLKETVISLIEPSSDQVPAIANLSRITADVFGVSIEIEGAATSTASPRPTSHEMNAATEVNAIRHTTRIDLKKFLFVIRFSLNFCTDFYYIIIGILSCFKHFQTINP